MGVVLPGRGDSYLYNLQPSSDRYHAGVRSNGDQVLVIKRFPDAFALEFDGQGRFCDVTEIALSPETKGVLNIREPRREYFDHVDADIEEWLQAAEFTESPILIRRFYLDDLSIGIKDFPAYFEEVLEHPESHSFDDCKIAEDTLRWWKQKGTYELWLDETEVVWINQDGCIEAT
jgi:hypothetical protein